MLRPAIAAGLLCSAASVLAQSTPGDVATAASESGGAVQPTVINLAKLTPVELTVVEEVSSKTATNGDPVHLILARPLYLSADLGIPAGTAVEGIVIHAAKGGMGGKSGELLIAAKRIALSDSVSIPLRSFQLGAARGKNNEGVAMGAAIAGGVVGGIAAMVITGGSAKAPAGASAFAKTSADIAVPAALLTRLPPRDATLVAPVVPAAVIVQPSVNSGK